MRILYGIQTNGIGHISRSVEVIRKLKLLGHNINILLSGPRTNYAYKLNELHSFDHYNGFTLLTANGRVKIRSTVGSIELINFVKDIYKQRSQRYDLVISDFEPVSAHFARKCKIPSIGIGHQYAFQYKVPIANSRLLSRLILNNFAPVDYSIGLHWHHFNQPVLPPIVPANLEPTHSNEKVVVVYLPYEDKGYVKKILKTFKAYTFDFYTDIKEPETEDNIRFKPISRDKFISDLQNCTGVICNAGFELPSETLHLGKKLLVKPLLGQVEQESNASAIHDLGLGGSTRALTESSIGLWLSEQHRPGRIRYPDVSNLIANWISACQWGNINDLASSAWDGCTVAQ